MAQVVIPANGKITRNLNHRDQIGRRRSAGGRSQPAGRVPRREGGGSAVEFRIPHVCRISFPHAILYTSRMTILGMGKSNASRPL